jgi:hypothetical protein
MTASGSNVGSEDALLRAGALLPVEARVDAEKISARVYRHAALGERAVINLVPDPIGEAEDLALQTLDFELEAALGPVALGRPRGLGFPASAILADPANARYALDVVKEMERFGRMARSKPGNAKDGFDEIAARLARSVPHFLPSFREQAGRMFLEAGAPAQAATQFAKAREAERVYSLPVDEAQRRQSFLEFALSGALTAKALAEYVSDLVASQAPGQAHDSLKQLCLQRTLGGLPPWATVAADLRRTARAAGLDVAGEEEGLLRQLLVAPAVSRARAGFWTGYRTALIRMARSDASVRGLLLNLHPVPPEAQEDFTETWLGLLKEIGAFQALVDPDSEPPEAGPRGGTGAWLERTAQQAWAHYYHWRQRTVTTTHLLDLLPSIAPAIAAEERPVQLFVRGGVDVDLLDAALAAGIKVAQPGGEQMPYFRSINLIPYSQRSVRRPLTALGASEDLRDLVDGAIDAAVLHDPERLAEMPGLHEPLRRWLRRQAERLRDGTLITLSDAVAEIETGATPAVCALDPDTARQIARTDVAAALGRTLRGGLLAELAWPALEKAPLDLSVASVAGAAWPALIVNDKKRAAVIGPSGTILSHDLRLPSKGIWGTLRQVEANSQLFVGWRGQQGTQGYWSGRPGELFEPSGGLAEGFGAWDGGAWSNATSLSLPDGSRFEGGLPIHAGDRKGSSPRRIVSDGVTTWVLSDSHKSLREVDPETGHTSRASLPRFLEEFAAEGWEVDLEASWLMPLPAGADASAIGTRDGLIGFRARRRKLNGRTEWDIEGVDGRRFRGTLGSGPEAGSTTPALLVRLPGDENPRPVSFYGSGSGIVVWTADGAFPLARVGHGSTSKPSARPGYPFSLGAAGRTSFHELLEGLPFVAPVLFWFALRHRQEAGSMALRTIDDATVRRIFDGAMKNSSAGTVPGALPAVTDEGLRAGIAGAGALAARLARKLAALEAPPKASQSRLAPAADAWTGKRAAPQKTPAGQPAVAAVPSVLDDTRLRNALLSFVEGLGYWYGGEAGRPLEQMATVAMVMSGKHERHGLSALFGSSEAAKVVLPECRLPWFAPLGRLGAVALRAALATTSDEVRDTLGTYLLALARNDYPARSAWTRHLTIKLSEKTTGTVRLAWTGSDIWFVRRSDVYDPSGANWTGVQYSKNGAFPLPRDSSLVSEERRGPGWGDNRSIERFLEDLRRRGPIPWDPAAVTRLQELTGLSRAAAALLLATLPGIDSYEHNFLDSTVRETLGIKLTEANAARGQLKTLKTSTRLALLDYAMPPNPDELWDRGLVPVAERIAQGWVHLFGRSVAIDEETLTQASRQLAIEYGLTDPLAMLANPNDQRLTVEPPIEIKSGWGHGRATGECITAVSLRTVATAVPWVHQYVPAGHPLQAQAATALNTVWHRLQSPTLVLPLDTVAWPNAAAALRAMGAQPYRPPRGATVEGTVLEVGPILAAPVPGNEYVRLWLRPAYLNSRLPEAAAAMIQTHGGALLNAVRFILSPGAASIAGRLVASPLAPGSFEADPSKSVPGLVQHAAGALGVPEPSARLFLQILSLSAPTKVQIQKWNGWTATDLTKATKPLLDRGLVVSGQRSRSGRDVFLPGPWVEIAAPDLPVEAWKLPLYGAAGAERSAGTPLDRLLPLIPLHDLFAMAWARWQSGDRPAFEEPPGRAGRR